MLFGLLSIAAGAVLVYLGMPEKGGENPRFLRFGPALVTYPPLILALLGLGAAQIISSGL